MAVAAKVKGSYLDLAFGNGADPEVFTPICGLENWELSRSWAAAFEAEEWDCANPEDSGEIIRDVGAEDWSMTGSGLYNRSQRTALEALMGIKQNWRFIVSEPAADNISDGYYQGSGFISAQAVSGERKGWTQMSVTITAANGKLPWTNAA